MLIGMNEGEGKGRTSSAPNTRTARLRYLLSGGDRRRMRPPEVAGYWSVGSGGSASVWFGLER